MPKEKTPTVGMAGAKESLGNKQQNPTPKAPNRQAYCQDCRHFCAPITRGKLLPERVFCYCTGHKTSHKSLACELYEV